ncbi:MAG: hypothetical protein R3B45_11310 [Bdellovibrionota bacterium]
MKHHLLRILNKTSLGLVLLTGYIGSQDGLASQRMFAKSAPTGQPRLKKDLGSNTLPSQFVSDGNMISLSTLGITLAPPAGWNVYLNENGNGPTVIMEEPKQVIQKKKLKKPITTYQRNITLSIKHEPTPIDASRGELLAEELKKNFSRKGVVSHYEILEHKVLDLNDGQKGLLVYASFKVGNVDMMQMHFLISGDQKQYLQTYTDLAKRFIPEDAGFSQAWAAITSLQVPGKAPIRFQRLLKISTLVAGALLIILIFALYYKRKRKKDLERSVFRMENGDGSSIVSLDSPSSGWAIFDSNDTNAASDDVEELPVTKVSPMDGEWVLPQVEAVSGFDTVRLPKVRVKEESSESEWVLPVKTRVSPTRIHNSFV